MKDYNDPDQPQLTDKQQQCLELFMRMRDKQAVANALGLSRSAVRDQIRRIEQKGLAPWLTPAPVSPTMHSYKTTVQYNADGVPIQEWRRLQPRMELMTQIVDELCEKVRGIGKAAKRKERKTDTDELLFEIDIYDAHVGLYADEKETLDENYDCDIAALRMVEAVEALAARARRPRKVVLVFGGDMLHADNRTNKTEASGHVLDVDTRYARVVDYIVKASKDCVQIAAAIGAEVEMVILEGNHSYHSEIWLARVLHAMYEGCDNVNVRLDRSPRKHMVFGKNLLVWSHGDRVAAQKWAMIIAAEFPREWGQTVYRHLKCGHIHHQKTIAPVVVDEQAGLLVEFLPALCATDAYHVASGYVGNQKGAVAYDYHKDHGCITRYFNPV